MWQDSLSSNKSDLKSQTDLRLVAEQILGQPARRSARYVQYHAPSRRDSSPSLTIWADGYKDFGSSDDGGDLFAFLSTYANLSFQDALQYLTGTSQLASASRRPTMSDQSPSQTHLPSAAWQSAVSGLLAQAQHTLWHTPAGHQARAYLESQGYLPSTIQSRGLGLNLRWHRLHIADESEPVWVAPGILYPWRQADVLYGVKIRLPYHRANQPDALARCLNLPPGPMKYMQIKGSCLSQTWYGDITHPTLPLMLVEGEKDRDNLWQNAADQLNVITLGSATGRIPDSLWPHLKQAAWIAVVLDNDAAGQSNAARLADHLNSRLLDNPAFTASLPTTHKDLTDWLLSGADLSAWLSTLTLPSVQQCGDSIPPRQMERGSKGEVSYSPPCVRGGIKGGVAPSQPTESELGGEVAPTFFPNGLPDALREILLGLHQLTPQGRAYIADHSAAALVLELITDAFRNNHLSNSNIDFTIQRLAEISIRLNRHTSAKTIRRGLDQLVALHLIELIPFSTPSEPISNLDPKQGCENGNNSFAASSPFSTQWGGAGGGDSISPSLFLERGLGGEVLAPLPMFGEGPGVGSVSSDLNLKESDASVPPRQMERGSGGEVSFSPLSTQWGGVGGGENPPATPTTRGRPAQKYRPCDFRYALPKFLENLANRLRESLYAATIPDAVDPTWFEHITTDPTTRTAWADAIAAATTDLDQSYADLRVKMEEELDLRLYALSLRLNWNALVASTSTPIPADLPFASGRAYRDAYYQARVAAAGSEGRQIARAKAAAEIGVNSRTLTRVRERVGIVTEEQFKEFRLCLSSAENILEQAERLAPWAAHRPFGRYLKSSGGARIALHPESTHPDQWVSAQISQGHTVVLQIQIASREHLTTPAEARQQRQHRLTQYCARCSKPTPPTRPSNPSRRFRTTLRSQFPCSNVGSAVLSPLSTQWGGAGGGDSVPPRQMERGLGGEVAFSPLPNALGRGQGWGYCFPPATLETESASEVVSVGAIVAYSPPYVWGGAGGGVDSTNFRFSLAYIHDQLALRLPYLDATLQSDPTLRAAINWIMGRSIAMLAGPFSL